MVNLYKIYYTISDVKNFIEETEPLLFDLKDDIINPDPIRDKVFQLKRLYSFYTFHTPCKKAVEELKKIFEDVNTLDHELISGKSSLCDQAFPVFIDQENS